MIDIIILAVVISYSAYIIYKTVKNKSKGKCSSCSQSQSCPNSKIGNCDVEEVNKDSLNK